MGKYCQPASLLCVELICLVSVVNAQGIRKGVRVERTFGHDGQERSYLIHIPSSYRDGRKVPLMFVFHGGGGKAEQIARHSGYDGLSEKHGFIVVYPQAIDGHWNDGREGKRFLEHDSKIDDAGFVIALLDTIKAELAIDVNSVFATGLSNGGIFSHRLGIEQSRHFAAIAPVIGGIAEPLANKSPEAAVSVLIMNGTEDPLVPYEGGAITVNLFPGIIRRPVQPDRGRIISTEKAIQFWLKHNGIISRPKTIQLPDVDPNDGCRIETTEWSDDERGASVLLYKVIGGGHTYPGGAQYLPEPFIGKTCRDLKASEVIWVFFSKHSRAQPIPRSDVRGKKH